MKNRFRVFVVFIFLISVFCLTENRVISASASTTAPVDFSNSTGPVGYDLVGTESPLYTFELWHHSGRYWSNQVYGIRIDDRDLERLSGGEISSGDLNTSITTTIPLPANVKQYLSNGGSLNDVQLRFRTASGLDPDEIYRNPRYNLTAEGLTINTQLILFVSEEPFARVDGVNFLVWKPLTEKYGRTTFSIFTRSGQHLGAAYTAGGVGQGGYHPVEKGDILNSQGHLKGGKQYTIFLGNGQTITRDGSEIQVGYGTFASGGAVGMNFNFPIIVDFYIPSDLDTVKVNYIDDNGNELLPSEIKQPDKEGSYTVSAKTIPGYDLIEPATGKFTINIGRDGRQHEVTFVYAEPIPEPGGPIARFTWSPVSPETGQRVNFTDQSYHPDGLDIVKWEWYVDIDHMSNQQHPSHTFNQARSYIVVLTVTDENGLRDTAINTIYVRQGTRLLPPNACINAPRTLQAGDMASISSCSWDEDGEIVGLDWNWTGKNISVGGNLEQDAHSGFLIFTQPGQYAVQLRVTDNDGLTDWEEVIIDVTPPYPVAIITIDGTEKENRRVSLDAGKSFGTAYYPVDTSKTTWEITPLEGQDVSSIKVRGGSLNGHRKDVLFKETGQYQVLLTVYNTYGNKGQMVQILNIEEDVPPVARFTITPGTSYRDPLNDKRAIFTLRDVSYSIDDDFIQQRIWSYAFDTQNDGSYENDNWIIIDDQNRSTIELEVTQGVGRYYFSLEVIEGFGQDTLLEFITPDDYRRDKD